MKLGQITRYKLPIGGGTGNAANVGEDLQLVKGGLVLMGVYFAAKAIWSWGTGEVSKVKARTAAAPAGASAAPQPGAATGSVWNVHQ